MLYYFIYPVCAEPIEALETINITAVITLEWQGFPYQCEQLMWGRMGSERREKRLALWCTFFEPKMACSSFLTNFVFQWDFDSTARNSSCKHSYFVGARLIWNNDMKILSIRAMEGSISGRLDQTWPCLHFLCCLLWYDIRT